MSQTFHPGVALVTGASSGIGATYFDRLAKRGFDLLLVARNEKRLEAIATKLRCETSVQVEILKADLSLRADVVKVEQRLRSDERISMLSKDHPAARYTQVKP